MLLFFVHIILQLTVIIITCIFIETKFLQHITCILKGSLELVYKSMPGTKIQQLILTYFFPVLLHFELNKSEIEFEVMTIYVYRQLSYGGWSP